MEQYDTLLHLSSQTETPLRSINNFLLYFLLWTGGLQSQPSFISMNQLCTENVIDTGIAKFNIRNIKHPDIPNDLTNYHEQYLQGYWEVKDGADYSAVSLKTAIPISKTTKLEGADGNWCYVTKYRRYTDDMEFYYIQMTQTYGGYLYMFSYKAISELLQYIQEKYPGLYIIVGNFNVHGHEQVFEHFLGADKYHICPLYLLATCNDDEGIASPDGLVVSKELYNRVEYGVDFYLGYSYKNFIVRAKLFANSSEPGTYDTTDSGFQNFLTVLKSNTGNRHMYMGHKGVFNNFNQQMIGTPLNINEISIRRRGPDTIVAMYTVIS